MARHMSEIFIDIANHINQTTDWSMNEDPCYSGTNATTRREYFYIIDYINKQRVIQLGYYKSQYQTELRNVYRKPAEDILNDWDDQVVFDLNYLLPEDNPSDADKLEAFYSFLTNNCAPGAFTAEQARGLESEATAAFDNLLIALGGDACPDQLNGYQYVDCETPGQVKIKETIFYTHAKFNEIFMELIREREVPSGVDIYGSYVVMGLNDGQDTFASVRYALYQMLEKKLYALRRRDEEKYTQKWVHDRLTNYADRLTRNASDTPTEDALMTRDVLTDYLICLANPSCESSDNIMTQTSPIEETVGGFDFVTAADQTSSDNLMGLPCENDDTSLPESFLHATATRLINEIDDYFLLKKKDEVLLKEIAFQLIDEVSLAHTRDTPGRDKKSGGGGGGRRRSRRTQKKREAVFNATGGGNSSIASEAQKELTVYGAFTETDGTLKDRIQGFYYPEAGIGSSADPTTTHWSAAFIAFCSGPVRFFKHAKHQTYMQKAKDKRDSAGDDYQKAADAAKRGYFAFLPNEKHPVDGDICCYATEGSGDGWDNIGNTNHCDVYNGGDVIGGNLSNKVKSLPYNSTKYSMIISKGAIITVPEDSS